MTLLVLIGALGTVDVVVSFVTFFVLGKARNGSVAVIDNLLGSFSTELFVSLLVVACIAVGLSTVFALVSAGYFASMIDFFDFNIISVVVLIFLVLMSFWLSGFLGLLVLVIACLIGFIAPLTGVSRMHAMGCLLLPTLALLW